MKNLVIDRDYMLNILRGLLAIPSPSGMTDAAVAFVCAELESLGIPYELTRRGAIRADLKGRRNSPDRAIVSHLDTLGAMVKGFWPNGRLEVVPIGTWSARFAEGARCLVHTDANTTVRGSILPHKASGHVYNEEVDTQPIAWSNLEVRLDERTSNPEQTKALGIHVGDTISIDTAPEFLDNGFIVARHLDDKAGVAAMLAAARAICEAEVTLPIDCHLIFTISEEVGVGASTVLHGDVAELVSIDNGTIAPGQYTSEFGVTIAMQDSSGPFDRHLTRSLLDLCARYRIEHARDVFRYYRSDAASAVEAGNDIRTSLVCFALDASHGYERTHVESLEALARLLCLYMQSKPLFARDDQALGPPGDLPPTRADLIPVAE
ncbi:MAG TPA: osmoprotectant NAGGN system M42 family peptidase [Ferrovibrio sp.]|jgi:peptidase M42 family hydrolase|uniref:osmoprotectant NAGGN system M42 family peptidase n=1 Tax=Ferrovibrio sp. TaxID=1917215 RepID=UPI002B4B43BB|nr:osmoprotectant NAGGN system M42 family peptidase [Ferrovibrio sp.]HLT79052.1 osmoprotectant NAGGN system M42 family peptidase [Ferrovibrio sp.]